MADAEETTDFRDAREQARKALLDAVTQGVGDIRRNNFKVSDQTAALKNLALVYRLVVGGAQPGGLELGK